MERLPHRVHRAERGFLLIEMMITISVLGVLLLVLAGLFTTVYNSLIISEQRLQQRERAQAALGWASSHLAAARGPFGLADSGEGIGPLSISADQLVFRSGGRCYRIFWRERTSELRGASALDCTSLKPVRGPNERDGSGDWLIVTDQNDPAYDPVLDDPARSFRITDQVVASRPTGAPVSDPALYRPLRFFADDGQELGAGARAGDGSGAPFYSDQDNRSKIGSVELTLYIGATTPQASSLAPVRYFSTMLAAGQAQPSASPAIETRLDGEAGTSSTISAGADFAPVTTSDGGPALQSAAIPSQPGWLEFSGSLAASGDGEPVLKAELYRNGAPIPSGQHELEPRTDFVYDGGSLSGSDPEQIPFQGMFRIPVSTSDTGSDTYRVRISIANSDASQSFTYSHAPGSLWLSYKVVPR